MRIIGGKHKGKKLFLPSDKLTRPLKDMVKESIFNLLQHSKKINISLEDSTILDLFSGTGSFGLECASRGAKYVVFFEYYKKALMILKKNIIALKVKDSCKIYENDCFKYFNSNFDLKKKVDIIFIDPPYKEEKINDIFEIILKKKILKMNGILIIHRHKKDTIKISEKLKLLDKRDYGNSRIFFGN